MVEDYMATTRNGHELKDMYNPETNTLDIRSNGLYPSNVLSNLCSNGFRLDGMICNSMEGFLQSLKRKELDKQRQICSMKGGYARKMTITSWQTDQIVWWKGQAIDRQGAEFQQLIRRAYQAMFEQSERFRAALMQTRGMILTHSSGSTDSYRTILTSAELCGILTELRDNYDQRDKTQELIEKSVHRKKLIYLHGFGSSAASSTVQTLMELLFEFDVIAPDIPVDPFEALSFLRGLCMNEVPDVIIGTSMGGMYAQQLRGYKRICINPAFDMSKKDSILSLGTHEYFKPRKDGTTHFDITKEIVRHHSEMEERQFEGITDNDREQVWGLFADNDQLVNYETLFSEHYSQVIHFQGGHRLDNEAIKVVLVPLIRDICK